MIELLCRHIHFFPCGCRVAGVAGSLELAFVRIRMTSGAGSKIKSGVFHRFFGAGGKVALFAGDLGVRACQRIFCFRMIELLGLLPALDVMALPAIWPELAFVWIGVAGGTVLGQPHERFRKIFFFNQCAGRRGNMRWRVAFLAGDPGMFVHEGIARQAMVELLERGLPVDEAEVLAIVFEVASHAVPAVGILHPQLRMKAFIR